MVESISVQPKAHSTSLLKVQASASEILAYTGAQYPNMEFLHLEKVLAT
jgi:hypothetical protein